MSEPWWSAVSMAGPAWSVLLAFTGATALVLLLRRPARRLFGARRAFALWLLPPLAMLASQLPHPALVAGVRLPNTVFAATSAVGGWVARANVADPMDGYRLLPLVWFAGAALQLLYLLVAQNRYRFSLRDAVVLDGLSPWPVLRAIRPDIGPALVGCWRPSIVLPGDFERRYDPAEQALILAHESSHARRRDGWWCLLGRVLAMLFWFHPLAWWAFAALRHDQELACDATVLERHAGQRRIYASAMLKTLPTAMSLPVGCHWSTRHPLTERIAMLKQPLPSRRRRAFATLAGLALIGLVTGSVYAASAPPASSTAGVTGPEYQLDLRTTLSRVGSGSDHAEYARMALCMKPGEPAAVQTHGWEFVASTVPAAGGRVKIRLSARQAGDAQPLAHMELSAMPGQGAHGEAHGSDGKHTFLVDVTPHAGCPARASQSAVMVSEQVANTPARLVAEDLAGKAGWVLVNPQALGNAPVKLAFRQIPADRALWLVADMVGMKPVFEGKRVRFEAR